MFRLLLYSHLQAEPKKCYTQLTMRYRARDLVYMLLMYIMKYK